MSATEVGSSDAGGGLPEAWYAGNLSHFTAGTGRPKQAPTRAGTDDGAVMMPPERPATAGVELVSEQYLVR
jgi:hypothetical protein